jgi:hypothetical protein
MGSMSASHHPTAGQQRILTGWRGLVLAVAVTGLSFLVFILTATPGPGALWPRWAAMMALAWWLPGALLVGLWRLPDLDLPTALLFALGLGWAWMMLLLLLVHWLPGEIGFWSLALTYGTGAVGLGLALQWRQPLPLAATPRVRWLWLLGLLLLSLALRIPGLGYHEFHYDEVLVLTRAREAIRGEDDALARHTKGPGEIAVGAVVFRTLGTANEATARLPFGMASVASVLALALLARRMFESEAAGFWSGALLALNGFALGLSRIVQYQAGVLLLMILAVLAAWRFAQSGLLRWIVLSAALGALGLVLHYEFGLVAPALLYLLVLGWKHVENQGRALGQLGLVAAGGAALLAAVYLPLAFNPYFEQTQGYIDSRLGSLGSTFNLPFFLEMGTFYNSVYYFAGLMLLMLAGLIIGWRWHRRATTTLVIWFTPFLVLYLFIVQFPGTHFYLLMPSWSILGGVTLARMLPVFAESRPAGQSTSAAGSHAVRWLVGILVVAWMAVSAHYLYLMFFRQQPEYLINYQEEHAPFYWAPYGENVPEKPRFGFPIWEGWKTLGVLSEWKYLNGTYAANERSRHLRWYLGDFDRVSFEEMPDFIFVARHLQEPDPDYHADRLNDYAKIGEVTVRGEPRVEIWARTVRPVPYLRYDAAAFSGLFDGLGPTFREWPDPAPVVTDVPLDGQVTLVSAGAAPRTLGPGDVLHTHLVWQTSKPLPVDYKRFLHIADEAGRPVAQLDGYPGLDTGRTSAWLPGEPFDDHVLLVIPADVPPGSYRLLTGLYDPETGARVGDKAIDLGGIELR